MRCRLSACSVSRLTTRDSSLPSSGLAVWPSTSELPIPMTRRSHPMDTWQGLCVSHWLRMEPGLTTSLVAPATATAGDAFATVDELERGLRDQRYVAERGLATTLYLTLKLGKPLLLEGEAGVGKTEIAKVLADVLRTPLIRLQCYEGLDA